MSESAPDSDIVDGPFAAGHRQESQRQRHTTRDPQLLRWTVGDVTITRLQEMEMAIPYNPATPFMPEATPEALLAIEGMCPRFVTEEGDLRISTHALLVEAPGLRLVVDTCVGNDRVRAFICDEPLANPFPDWMRDAGFPPETVSHVLCTHMHVDHVGWNTTLVDGEWLPTFPQATYLFAREEYAHYRAEAEAEDGPSEQSRVLADSVTPIVAAGLARFVETDHRLSDEISLFSTPGHTPGHVSVRIASRGQTAIITGDAIHHPAQMTHPDWSTAWEYDRAQSFASRAGLLDAVADRPVLVIGTHFASPTAGHVARCGPAYRFIA